MDYLNDFFDDSLYFLGSGREIPWHIKHLFFDENCENANKELSIINQYPDFPRLECVWINRYTHDLRNWRMSSLKQINIYKNYEPLLCLDCIPLDAIVNEHNDSIIGFKKTSFAAWFEEHKTIAN